VNEGMFLIKCISTSTCSAHRKCST